MDDVATVSIGDGIARRDEAEEQLPQREWRRSVGGCDVAVMPANGLGQRFALDETHRIARPAARVVAQAVHRHDAGMLQPARDAGFSKKAFAAGGIVGRGVLHPFQGDFALEFVVGGEEQFADAALGVPTNGAIATGGGATSDVLPRPEPSGSRIAPN